MPKLITWPGADSELRALLLAIAHHCTCTSTYDPAAQLCSAHMLLTGDQKAISRLLFGRRLAEKLRQEEHASPMPERASMNG